MAHLDVWVRYHAVGQGLFTSGTLHGPAQRTPLNWVFDCGSSSGLSHIQREVLVLHQHLAGITPRPPRVHLVALSHFDADHINGVAALLQRLPVDVLLLPYAPPWVRITQAFSDGVGIQDPEMQAYLDPVAFLSAVAGSHGIGSILFVPGSDSVSPLADDAQLPDEPQLGSDDDTRLDFRIAGDLPEETAADLRAMGESAKGARVGMLEKNSSLVTRSCYEFVPYNDASYDKHVTQDFQRDAMKLADELRDATGKKQREECLGKLKDLYDGTFGKTRRNLISLFMYAGPLRVWRHRHTREYERSTRCHWPHWTMPPDRTAHLYTGDGSLSTPARADDLARFLQPRRLARLYGMQVMHHGSQNSWCQGVGRRFSPARSLFCADPHDGRYHHPDDVVMDDFRPYRPIIIDKSDSLWVVHNLAT